MNQFILVVSLLLFSVPSFAVQRKFRDLKLPTQAMVEKQTIDSPIALDDNRILSDEEGDTDGNGATVTTFLAQPDVPRNVIISPSATTADVKTGNFVFTGTDFYGTTITETIAVADNQSSDSTGTKAFKTVTSIVFPAEDSPYTAQFDIGVGDVLGLKRCMAEAGDVLQASLGGTKETTDPTGVASASTISSNTVDLNSAYDGSSDVTLYFIQNFRCSP